MKSHFMFYMKCTLSAIFGLFTFLLIITNMNHWGWFILLALVSIPDGTVYIERHNN